MLENESLWNTTQLVHDVLARKGLAHAIVGSVAVCLHGYRRNTVDIDLLVEPQDATDVRAVLEAEGFQWSAAHKEFRSGSGVPIQGEALGGSIGDIQGIFCEEQAARLASHG